MDRGYEQEAPAPLRNPWIVLFCAAAIVTIAMGIRQSFGLFLRQIELDVGVGREAFGLTIAIQNLIWASPNPSSELWQTSTKLARRLVEPARLGSVWRLPLVVLLPNAEGRQRESCQEWKLPLPPASYKAKCRNILQVSKR